MLSGVIIAILAVLVLINALLGLRRGALRSMVRLVMLLITVPIAVLVTRWVAGAVGHALLPVASSALAGLDLDAAVIENITEMVDALGALITMLVAALSFAAVYQLLGLLSKLADKPLALLCENKFKIKLTSRLIGLGVGAVCGLVLAVAILSPFTGLLPIAGNVVSLADDDGSMQFAADEMQSVSQSPACKAVNMLGGDWIFSAVTTTEYKEEKVNLTNEADALTGVVAGVLPLTEKNSAEWGEEEIENLDFAADSFERSHIVVDIAATLLSNMGNTWGNGEPFFGIDRPDVGELLDPTIVTLMQALSKSSSATVRQNVHTLADVVGAMIRYDVFETIQPGEEKDDLSVLVAFSNTEFTTDVVDALYRDEQLRVLIPEVLNLSVRALAQALNVPANHAVVYDNIMENCSVAFNQTKGMPDVDRMVTFGDSLYEILSDAGVGVSPSAAVAIATGIVADYGNMDKVTAEDMMAWFAGFALAMQGEGEQIALQHPGAASAAAYITAMQTTVTPYQIITLTNREDDRVCYVVSMSDGTLRVYNRDFEEIEEDIAAFGTIGALKGGEFSVVQCADPWTLTAGPARINGEQLAALRTQLRVATPFPEGYTPTVSADTSLTFRHLQNAQNITALITDTESLLTALESAANHELVRGTYSAGTMVTMSSADQFTSALPCLSGMLIHDLDSVCANLTEDSAASVGVALSSLARFVADTDLSDSSNLSTLFGGKGSDVVSTLLDSMTAVSGSKDAAVNTLLAGANALGADINSLRGTLEGDDVSVSEVAGQMLGTTDVLASLNNASTPEEQIDAMEKLLSELTEGSARAIASAISPNMLKQFGFSDTVANTTSSMIRSAFSKLADAKKNGMTEEQFRHEADAMNAALTIAQHIREEADDATSLFGDDGAVGKDVSDVLETVLNSNIISNAMIEMVGGTTGAYFTVANANPFHVRKLNDHDREAIMTAIERVEATLPQIPASNGELWSPQNNQVTRQDMARRLTAFASLFGIEYTTEHANIQ